MRLPSTRPVRTLLAVLVAACVAVGVTPAPGTAVPSVDRPARPTVAVFPPTVTAPGFSAVAWKMTKTRVGNRMQAPLIAALRDGGARGVLTPKQLKNRMAAAGITQAPTSAASAGAAVRALGVDYVMYGNVTRLDRPTRSAVSAVTRYKVASVFTVKTGELDWVGDVRETIPGLTLSATRPRTTRLIDRIAAGQAQSASTDDELAAIIDWLLD